MRSPWQPGGDGAHRQAKAGGDRPPSALGGPDGWKEGWERNNKAVNHDTKHAFILFTKTAWIAKTLQTAFQFNDVERAGETGI